MNVLELVVKGSDGAKVAAWACGVCRIISPSPEGVALCCAPRVCGCGTEIKDRIYTACEACREKTHREREKARFDKAEKIPAAGWNGVALYCGECSEYFQSVEEFIDGHEDQGHEMPRYAWDCDPHDLKLDARGIVYRELEDDFHEGAEDQIDKTDFEALQQAMDEFCESVAIRSWMDSGTRVVLLDAEVTEYLKENWPTEEEEAESAE